VKATVVRALIVMGFRDVSIISGGATQVASAV
jgi:hypothetical protein